MKILRPIALSLFAACGSPPAASAPASAVAPTPAPPAPSPLRITVSFPPFLSATPLDGRVLVVLAKKGGPDPITQVSDRDDTAQVFGVDADALAPERTAVIDGATLGYPVASLASIPPGDYVVQAALHRYETFVRGDGHIVKLPPDRGEGQDWTRAPGNLVSAPMTVRIDPSAGGEIHVELARALPLLPEPQDTPYVKYVRIQSERLTKFWGRPTYLGGIVLLPAGYEANPKAHYPLAIAHGHFTRTLPNWRETPPDPGLPAVDLEGLRVHCPNGHEGAECAKYGYPRLEQEHAYAAYRKWTAKGFPRALLLYVQHANPYYDDSYAVNSENVGPYGDAITYELVPYVEKTFRGLGPWARGMFGGSTGGWEALAAQVLYPKEYNGAIVNCPDPIDFRAYMTVNLYEDANAYYSEGPFRRTPRPSQRDYLGRTRATIEQDNLKELVLGTRSRSGGQWDVWQAVFSPVGADGYPQPIWDKRTGSVDPRVAAYWKEHWDLGHVMARDWATLGPELRGKITLNVGRADNFFLNDAVYFVEDFLKTADPPADAVVSYGARDEHCWSGDATTFNGVSRLTYVERFVPQLAKRWLASAPKGADVTSWRY